MDVEQALATLEAFIAGGDELDIVKECEALDAISYLRQFLKAEQDAQRKSKASQIETNRLFDRLFANYLLRR